MLPIKSLKYFIWLFLFFVFLIPFSSVFAHEAYVLPINAFWSGLGNPISFHALDALKSFENVKITFFVTLGVVVLIIVNFLFRLTWLGRLFHGSLEKLAPLGPFFVRGAISASFFFSAQSNSFLGPELSIDDMPYAIFIRWGLYLASFMIAVGLLTELAALIALVAFTISFFVFGTYMITYFNYLGEIIVLLLFGMRVWSFDRKILGPLKRLKSFEKYETTIVRAFYGIALMYAAFTVKFLHPDLSYRVVVDWNLTQFHFLFPSDPLLVVLGAALAEFAIGFLILVGFEMRLVVLISLFYITLSLLYFRELVWPHLMLYGISLNLVVQPEILTIDHFIFKKHRLLKNWWHRPFSSHLDIGKSERHEKARARSRKRK